MEFDVELGNPGSGWQLQLTPPSIVFAGGEFVIIEALRVPAPGAPLGQQETFFVSAVNAGCLLGGVVIEATVNQSAVPSASPWAAAAIPLFLVDRMPTSRRS